jgi:acetyltransferase-like isoleucine patch superfamily enzyme
MSSIKFYCSIKRLLYFDLLKRIFSRFFYLFYKIKIHYSVRISGEGAIVISGNVHIDEFVVIYLGRNSSLLIGDNCTVGPYSKIVVNDNDCMEIRENSSIQSRCEIHGSVIIGKSTLLAPNCFISSGTHAFAGNVNLTIKEKDKILKSKNQIKIGNDCWLGVNSVILPNSTIGDKCVIGANVVFSGELSERKIVKIDRRKNIIMDIVYSK